MQTTFKAQALLAFLWLSIGLTLVNAEPRPNPAPVAVERLVSRHYQERQEPSLFERTVGSVTKRFQKRSSGYANGGGPGNTGKGLLGWLLNKLNYEISFYHINDVHAHLDEFRSSGSSCTDPARGCVGGYPRVKAVLDKQRPTKKNSLLLNAGDEFQGTLFYTLYKGEATASILNKLGFDAFTLGNHEFDDGDDLLANFLANLTIPTISCNVKTTNQKLAKQLTPFKIWPKHRLAILAVTTEATKTISNPGAGTTFEDPVEAAKRTVKYIKRYHPLINKIVALTHIGYENDIKLAQQTTDISLIVGGHSHTLLADNATVPAAKGPYPTIVDNAVGEEVFVVTSFRWGEYLGYIDVEFDWKGRIVRYEGAPIHLNNSVEATKAEDPTLKAEVKSGQKDSYLSAGPSLASPRPSSNSRHARLRSATLVTSSQILSLLSRPATPPAQSETTQIPSTEGTFGGAIMNGGGIRAAIDGPGNVTLQQVLETFPFGNAATELTFTGRELWRIFEGIASDVNLDNQSPITSFVQVSSSIRLVIDNSKPSGSKLVSLSVANGEVIGGPDGENSEKVYTMATVDYLAAGGDSFWVPRTSFNTLATLDEIIVAYLRAVERVNVVLDGRISFA
ncbi:5'-nucleotidase [Coprinopsis sp. MPI-PUGE-AT-0042]|nr:5'-nucleotidase [Coprinopsis sp. MPI-PUGE-AT-0042]